MNELYFKFHYSSRPFFEMESKLFTVQVFKRCIFHEISQLFKRESGENKAQVIEENLTGLFTKQPPTKSNKQVE